MRIHPALNATAKMTAPTQSAVPSLIYDIAIQARPPAIPPAIPLRADMAMGLRMTARYITSTAGAGRQPHLIVQKAANPP